MKIYGISEAQKNMLDWVVRNVLHDANSTDRVKQAICSYRSGGSLDLPETIDGRRTIRIIISSMMSIAENPDSSPGYALSAERFAVRLIGLLE